MGKPKKQRTEQLMQAVRSDTAGKPGDADYKPLCETTRKLFRCIDNLNELVENFRLKKGWKRTDGRRGA